MSTICGYSTDEYIGMLKEFHGHLAPGLLIGGFMVDHALNNKPKGEFYDVLCETSVCLPDAVQILTPCTYGNGWLKVVNVGRFALTVFEKYTGEGVRVNLDMLKLDGYHEIRDWFLKLKTKQEQDRDELIREILKAEHRILGTFNVWVTEDLIGKKKRGKMALCPACGEAYPIKDGDRCLACQGAHLYR
jgi:formylmethanofuran dehydrogenase subunit E